MECINSVWMMIVFKIPDKNIVVMTTISLFFYQKMNEMLKPLMNKVPFRICPWNINKLAYEFIKLEIFVTILLEDTNYFKTYVFDYNRFLASAKICYAR